MYAMPAHPHICGVTSRISVGSKPSYLRFQLKYVA